MLDRLQIDELGKALQFPSVKIDLVDTHVSPNKSGRRADAIAAWAA